MDRLVASLTSLRAEFNTTFPGRDTSSDGWIGDRAHAGRVSDHNPDSRGLVHAIDVDADLGHGVRMMDVVLHIVHRCRAGLENRLKYVIFDETIWSASRDWKPRAYDGANPHRAHAHFSGVSTPALESKTSRWYLEDTPMALTAEDKQWIAAEIRKVVTGDADPTDRQYSLGGMITTIERRTEALGRDVAAIKQALAAPTEDSPS
jgi:hypothetical protein